MEASTLIKKVHPLLLDEVIFLVLEHFSRSLEYKWQTNLAQLFSLRRVCRQWKRQVEGFLSKSISLSLLPSPCIIQSEQYYMDSMHAALFHLTPCSYLGSPHYYNLFDRGTIKKGEEGALSSFVAKFNNLKYLSIVELNRGILNIINNRLIRLEGLAFDTLDESSVSESDLEKCCFNSSLEILSFSFFINRASILKFLRIFPSLRVLHFSSTCETYAIPFDIFHSMSSRVQEVYLGNRVVTFDGPARKSTFTSGNCQLKCLEMLSCSTRWSHHQQTLLNQLSSLQYLSDLHLDLTTVEHFDVIKSIGKIASITSLALILPSQSSNNLVFPLQHVVNSKLRKLVLVGDIEYPVLMDSQIGELQHHCPALRYLCVNSLLYTVKSADEYMCLLRSLVYLDELHIGYRPLVEGATRLKKDIIDLSRSFDCLKLIHWCDSQKCQCKQVDTFTLHSHKCRCSYFR